MVQLNEEVYRALGVDLRAIRVHYDLDPREGKTPVAFTTFGGRAPIEPWVFATYRSGGLDNLNELLHETGHAAHIAAIRTRPAFADWPDSDPFTEAVADFVALDVYEPAWQQRWLGDSMPLADGLRARYSGIVLDVAWALLELRMLRDPGMDPNEVWTALTRDYLRIRPHPELSWWAMRGQLVDEPGYMMNYAAGAILIAAIRARTVELHGPFAAGDSTWYGWIGPATLPVRPRAAHARGDRGVPRRSGLAGRAAGRHAAHAAVGRSLGRTALKAPCAVTGEARAGAGRPPAHCPMPGR